MSLQEVEKDLHDIEQQAIRKEWDRLREAERLLGLVDEGLAAMNLILAEMAVGAEPVRGNR